MAFYTSDSKERVREAVDFVELVSARTDLRRAGASRFEGLCPFHEERTPSFGIEPAKKVYYCFGCEASGDLFDFAQATEGLDFTGALELLADRYNVELELEAERPEDAARRRQRERLLELLARAAAFYERFLWDSQEAAPAREYLLGRGLTEELLRRFGVGYAPSAWNSMLRAGARGGFSEGELRAAGLVQRAQQDGRNYDRFRARITFPLSDIRGRVLGFGARAMSEGRGPKYLNSADNDLYHKGLHLYGAHLARPEAARAGEVILCEGYTDVIAMHQAGLPKTVGLMGTALTDRQLGELARMASTVLLALDADRAGQEAMLRAARLAAPHKLALRVVELPPGSDPADLIQREGPQDIKARVRDSVAFVRFRVQRVLEQGERASAEGRDRILGELAPIFAELPPSAMRMELTRLVSGSLEMPESVIEPRLPFGASAPPAGRRAARAAPSAGKASSERGPTPAGALLRRRMEPERTFLALCIATPKQGAQLLRTVDLGEHFTDELTRRAAAHLRDGDLSEPLRGVPEDERELAGLLAELTVQAGGEPSDPDLLEGQFNQLELARLDRLIQSARASGQGRVTELAKRRQAVQARLRSSLELPREAAE